MSSQEEHKFLQDICSNVTDTSQFNDLRIACGISHNDVQAAHSNYPRDIVLAVRSVIFPWWQTSTKSPNEKIKCLQEGFDERQGVFLRIIHQHQAAMEYFAITTKTHTFIEEICDNVSTLEELRQLIFTIGFDISHTYITRTTNPSRFKSEIKSLIVPWWNNSTIPFSEKLYYLEKGLHPGLFHKIFTKYQEDLAKMDSTAERQVPYASPPPTYEEAKKEQTNYNQLY